MKLIFVGDPMCSWCYGFSKEMASVIDSTPEMELQIVLGGMGAGSTQVLDDAGKRFRLAHWARVQQASGAEFNRDALLARQGFVYDTEPICRAVVTARVMEPSVSLLSVFRAFQRAFYVDGLDTTDGKVLAEVGAAAMRSAGFHASADDFFLRWSSEEVIEATLADFSLTRKLGVTGFPALFVASEGNIGRIASGFMTAAEIKQSLSRLAA